MKNPCKECLVDSMCSQVCDKWDRLYKAGINKLESDSYDTIYARDKD